MIKLDTIIHKHQCNDGETIQSIDFGTNGTIISANVVKTIVKFDDVYNDDIIYKKFISLMNRVDYLPNVYDVPFELHKLTFDNFSDDELTNFIGRRTQIMILMMSNFIAVSGRIGNGNFIIINQLIYDRLIKPIENDIMFNINIDDNLDNIIIMGKMSTNIDTSNIYCFHDGTNMCVLPITSIASKQYIKLKIIL